MGTRASAVNPTALFFYQNSHVILAYEQLHQLETLFSSVSGTCCSAMPQAQGRRISSLIFSPYFRNRLPVFSICTGMVRYLDMDG